MKKNIFKTIGILLIVSLCFNMTRTTMVSASAKTSYTIGPKSTPYEGFGMNFSTYNKYTRQYYTLRSYLELFEREGGGTLTLKAGTYTIPNVLSIPSNVTIKLNNGVVIKKGTKTGTKGLKVTNSIIHFVAPSKALILGAHSKYNGSSNIEILGKGNATMDLGYEKDCIGMVLGHNKDVTISGITFKNMYNGHFIELDASKNITIENNVFKNHKDSSKNDKEAINIDTPDKNTKGFGHNWSSLDATPNNNIIIKNNTFKDLERAIGTHKYTQDKYHKDIQIVDNTIINTDEAAIQAMAWETPVITGNSITNVARSKGKFRAVFLKGVINPTITHNKFKDVARPIEAMPWKNSGAGSNYDIIYNEISDENIEAMLENDLINVGERFIRINKIYNKFTIHEKYYFK